MLERDDFASRTLGRYELLTRLAVGGMAEIFLALERGTGGFERAVVIKRLLPHLAERDSFVKMFLREARIAARLSHPNVVQIYDVGESAPGVHFIAMEYVEGATARELQRMAEEQGLSTPPGAAAGIVVQACRGLHAAHELRDSQGQRIDLVHRDISPHNLMVTPQGHVKLLDFGVATTTHGPDATYSGALKGKFSYMSPEQCAKEPLDRRSDVFAMGIVLWELLTGERLFRRETELEMVKAVLEAEVPLPSSREATPPTAFDAVALRALARPPEQRFPTAEALRLAVEAAAAEASLDIGADAIARWVAQVAGERLQERRAALATAQVRTLVSEERDQLLARADVDSFPSAGEDEDTAVRRPTGPASPASPPRTWLLRRLIGVLGLVAFVGLFLYFASPRDSEPGGTPVAGSGAPDTPDGPPLPFGWPPVVDPDLLLADVEPFRLYLEQALQAPVPFIVTQDYADAVVRLQRGEIHFAALPPLLYVEVSDTDTGVELLAIKQYDGAVTYDGWLVVLADSTFRDLADLRGATFCFTDPRSASGYFLPRQHLRDAGQDPDEFVGAVLWSGQHLQALRDILLGKCDVAATYNGAFFSADDEGIPVGRLRLLAITGSAPQDAIVAGPGATREERQRLRQALFAFDPMAVVGRARVGEAQRITGFSVAREEQFAELRAAWRAEREAEGTGDETRPTAQP